MTDDERDTCAARKSPRRQCSNESAMFCWGVPLCWVCWNRLCDSGAESLPWLRKHVWPKRRHLIDEPETEPAPVATASSKRRKRGSWRKRS